MKSLERRFDNIRAKRPNLSSYACFAEAVRGQEFNKQEIRRWFYKLVDEEDYSRKDKKEVLEHLEGLSNVAEDNKI